MTRTVVKILRRWLYLGHRWLGICTCLLFAVWFVSGVVMMYVGFPALTDAERRAGLPALDWTRVQLSPTQALARIGADRFPRELRLAMLDGEPVYRSVGWDGTRRAVSAVDGRLVGEVDADRALAIAAHDPRTVRPESLGSVARDQWAVTARYDPLRPFHLVALGDPAGTHACLGRFPHCKAGAGFPRSHLSRLRNEARRSTAATGASRS